MNFVMYSVRGQWQEFAWTILFASGFAMRMAARFTGQLDSKSGFFPKRKGVLLGSVLVGSTLGGWYGYENSINAAHTCSCPAGENVLVLEYPHKKIVLPVQFTTQVPALVSYRGGHSWRLRFYSKGQPYDTVQLGVSDLRTAEALAARC